MGSPRRVRKRSSCRVDAYQEAGFEVEIVQEFETFARLQIVDQSQVHHAYKVELAANWRARDPVMMDIGPVLHIDDVAAGKMSALYTRAEPRDFLDVDAAVISGRYSHEQLCDLAEETDAGFDREVLAQVLGMVERYPDRRFLAYGADSDQIAAMRQRMRAWRADLLRAADPGQRAGRDPGPADGGTLHWPRLTSSG